MDVLLVILNFDTTVIEHTDEITQATCVRRISFLSAAKRSEVLDRSERQKARGADRAQYNKNTLWKCKERIKVPHSFPLGQISRLLVSHILEVIISIIQQHLHVHGSQMLVNSHTTCR